MKYIVILLFMLAPVLSHAQVITNAEWPVKEYFADAPDLVKIAYCESTYRQYDALGDVLRGRVDNDDIGVMQINSFYHEKTAEKLGYDIYTLQGNLAYAKWLYERYGTEPWTASESCWSKIS